MRLRRWASTCTRRWIFNISSGVAVFPLQLLSCKLFAVITVVTEFIVEGPDLEGMAALLARSGLPFVASGGVGSTADLQRLAGLEANGRRLSGAIVGKALVERRFSVEEGLAACAA